MAAIARNRWIISPAWDLLFFIASPILILAVMMPLTDHFSSYAIWLAVLGVSSVGHHLPGFIRAYGDRDLFQRFKWRFVVVPPFVLASALWFGFNNLMGLKLLLMFWSVWHVMMQHYGFMRIYDAKQGSFSPWTARLDWMVSLAWFVAIVLWSPQYVHKFLVLLFQVGTPFVSSTEYIIFRNLFSVLTGVVTIAYLVYNFQAIRRGEPISPIKLLLMVTTIAFLWVVWVYIDDIFLGLAVWEIFHDLQYFAIVWVYNRGLVDKGRIKGGFMQFLFRPRVAMIAIYGLLIFAYGMVGNASRYVAGNWMLLSSSAVATFNTVMVALVLTSTFLHYYYDGFIWKMRQADTREGLDIQGEGATSAGDFWDRIRTAWYARRAGVMQAAYVVLPIAALGLMEWNRQRDAIVTHQHVVMAVPAAMPAYQGLADAYYQEGHVDAAIETYREAVKRHPERDFEAWRRLGEALVTRYGFAKSDEAEGYFRNSLDIWPKQYEAWRNLGQLEQYTFSMTQDLARAEKSVDYLETAFRNGGKKDAKVLNLLGSGYSYLGKYEDAVAIFEQCLARHPNYLDALFNLGQTHLQRGDINTGWKLIEQAVQRDAKYEPAVRQLRKSLRASRPLSPANAQT